MAGIQLSEEDRRESLNDMLGVMIHQAVAEGSVGMVRATVPGTPDHEKWLSVAEKAVPLASDFLEGAKERHANRLIGSIPVESTVQPVPGLNPKEREQKEERLAKIEAEAARLRQELSE